MKNKLLAAFSVSGIHGAVEVLPAVISRRRQLLVSAHIGNGQSWFRS